MKTPMKQTSASSSSKALKVDERMEPKITIRPKELNNPSALDVDEVLQKICDGKQNIVTFEGASQYGDKLGNRVSASTCGLAALNFARTAFRLEREEGMRGLELLSELLSHKTTEEITSICDYWKSDSHLEIEELLKVPIFKNTLSLQTCTYSDASKQRFYELLRELDDTSPERSPDRSIVVIITRPPEIIACLKMHIADRDVYVIFDSHPRPSHPDGLGFIINPSIKLAASYLSDLLSFDTNLLSDPSLQWQAQLLGYFSGHVILPLEEEPSMTEVLLESSLTLLSSHADVAKERLQVSELREKIAELERQQQFMEERVKHLEKRRREEYEHYRESLRTHERERHERERNERSFWSTSSHSHSSSNPHHPPPSIPPATSASHWSPHNESGETGEGEWQTVWRSNKKDKGKGRFELKLTHGLPLSGIKNQNRATTASSSHREKSLPSPTSKRQSTENQFTASFPQNASMPGGLPVPFEAVSSEDRDIAIALELQRQFEDEDRQLTQERQWLQKMAPVTFRCTICLEDHPEDSVARVEGCEHSFCRECLRDHAKAKISERRFPIFCALCTTDKDRVEPGVINEIVLQQVGISNEDYKIFEELQITSFSIPLDCRRCMQTMFVDRQELQETKIVTCPWPRCRHVWCKACQQSIEVGGPQHSCDGSSELHHLMQQQGWKTCPGCNTPVQKSEGCNHMTCITPACNTHFCYLDGEMIVKGGTRAEIQAAMNKHYSKCKLFDYN